MKMGLSRKLLLPNFALIGILIFILFYLFFYLQDERQALLSTTATVKHQNGLLTEIQILRRLRLRAVLSYRLDPEESYLQTLHDLERAVTLKTQQLADSAQSPRQKTLLQRITESAKAIASSQDHLVKMIRDGDEEKVRLAFRRWSMHQRKGEAYFSDLTALTLKALDHNIALMDETRMTAFGVVGIGILVAAAMILLLWYVTQRQLVRPLLEMSATTKGIAKGDLSLRIRDRGRHDEIGNLAVNFNAMTESLAEARKALESSVAELSRSNGDLQQFAYISSHDLKEPLRMISIYSQILEKHSEELSEQARVALREVLGGARRMQTLIDDLLAYSRVSGSRENMHRVDLNQVLNTVKRDLKARLEESGARITAERLPIVEGHFTLLVQLLENLISNAIKFRGERDPVIKVSGREDSHRWILGIHDNGIGIKKEYWEKIFVIFQRLHTRNEYPGTGIGLSICKKIVERQNGQIWVESEPGKGTTFWISLPRTVAT